MLIQRTKLTFSVAALTAVTATLVACGSDGGGDTSATSSAASGSPVEQGSATPRLALSYDGGVLVYDAETLKQVGDFPVEGFTRLNSADNGRNVFISESDGFRVLDMGTWTRKHGDHGHHYTTSPVLTDMRFGGAEPGHVVSFEDRLTLFSDGTGEVNIVEPVELAQGNAASTTYRTPEPHHGVAVSRGDGTLVVTVGNEDTRSGIAILDKSRNEIARNDQCPGIHGEAEAAGGVLTFGCQDGILIVRGNEIQKVSSPIRTAASATRPARPSPRSCSATTRPTRTPSSNARIVSPSPILGPEPCASWTSRPAIASGRSSAAPTGRR